MCFFCMDVCSLPKRKTNGGAFMCMTALYRVLVLYGMQHRVFHLPIGGGLSPWCLPPVNGSRNTIPSFVWMFSLLLNHENK